MDFAVLFSKASVQHRMSNKFGVGFDNVPGFGAGGFDHFQILDRFHAEVGDAPLLGAGEGAGAAVLEVELGQFEAVGRFSQSFETFKNLLRMTLSTDEAVWLVRTTEDAAAELVE